MSDYRGNGYRVMSPAEYEGASKGQWADGPLVADDPFESGKKWLWTSKDDAKSWRDFLTSNNEVGHVIAGVPTVKPLTDYPRFPHPPQGPAVHVPISGLGPATPIDE